jgi:magnesium-transporting ATPase (P-type)
MADEEMVSTAEGSSEAAKPVGDFMAQVAAAIAVLFAFLTYYNKVVENGVTADKFTKGYETPYGIIIIAVGALCFIFASAVLWAKFLNKDFWLARSPGWLYMTCASIIIIVSVLAMVFPWKDDPNYGALVGNFFTGLFVAFGGLLKF